MASRLQDVIQRDTRANQPDATDVAEGTLYYVTDESVTERSNGTTWDDYSDTGSSGISQLTGDVTAGPGSGSQVATLGANKVTTAKIIDDAVTYAKIQDVSATKRILGRKTAAAGIVEELTLAEVLGLTTVETPQFARVGFGAAADASAVAKFNGQYYSPLDDDGNSGATITIDWDTGNEHYITLTGNVVLTLSNPKDGGRYVLVINTGAGGFTVTWPASVLWSGGVAAVSTLTASKYDIYTMIWLATPGKYLVTPALNF